MANYETLKGKIGRKPVNVVSLFLDKCQMDFGSDATFAPENLLTYSQEFDNAAWTKTNTTVDINQDLAPDFTRTMDIITNSNTNGNVAQPVTLAANTYYAASIYLKRVDGKEPRLELSGSGDTFTLDLDFGAGSGTVPAYLADSGIDAYAIEKIIDTTYRVTIRVKTGATPGARSFKFFPDRSATAKAQEVWGAQVERFPTARGYKVTGAVAVSAPDNGCQAAQSAYSNLLLYTEQFDNAAWTKTSATITANSSWGPNGRTTADSFLEAAATAEHTARQDVTVASASDFAIGSVYLRPNGRNFARLALGDSSGVRCFAYFDLVNYKVISTGTASGGSDVSATIEHAPGGFARCTIKGKPNNASTTTRFTFNPSADGVSSSYLGDITKGLFVWGAQVINGGTAKPYVRSEGTQGARIRTGVSLCYNTRFTCTNNANYSLLRTPYTFVDNIAGLPAGFAAFNALQDVTLAPTKIEPNSIGQRASVTITLRDFSHHDRGIDPYISQRNYDPNAQGSFFGRLRARNPYVINRPVVIRTGYIDDTFDTLLGEDFKARVYFIERIEGPDADGVVRVIAKDVLKFADNDRAQAPLPSDGELNADITDVATSLTITADYTSTYDAAGKIRVNEEIMSYASTTLNMDGTLTFNGLVRGLNGTVADAHETGDTVQLCLQYTNEKPVDILKDLLVEYADVPTEFIPIDEWTAENDEKLASHNMTVVVPEPTGVQDLLKEILESTAAYMWWDEVLQQIQFRASFPISRRDSVPELDDNANIVEDSYSVKEEEQLRVSEVVVFYNQINAIDENKKSNFSNIKVQKDTEKESPEEYGSVANQTIISRWMTSAGAAVEVAGRSINLFKNTPRRIRFSLDAKDSDLNTGDFIGINSIAIQGVDGANALTSFIVTRKYERDAGTTYEFEALEFNLGARVAYITPDLYLGSPFPDYASASTTLRDRYGFISDNFGFMSDGSEAYKIA